MKLFFIRFEFQRSGEWHFAEERVQVGADQFGNDALVKLTTLYRTAAGLDSFRLHELRELPGPTIL